MIREIIGGSAIANWLMPERKRHHRMMPRMTTAAMMVGLGAAAYMIYKNQNQNHNQNDTDTNTAEE